MRVIISAGGSGGHIYPALSIINKIKEKEPNSEFLYIGTHNRMEKDIVPSLGIKYESLEIYGFTKDIKRDIKKSEYSDLFDDEDILLSKHEIDEMMILYPYSKAIAQALIIPVPKAEIKEISYDELKTIKSERGMGALGSSNK